MYGSYTSDFPRVLVGDLVGLRILWSLTGSATNVGDMGNAHSEYLGPLSESGILGMLTFIAIVIAASITGLRVYKHGKTKEVRLIALLILLGLMSYFAHSFLNNFLDTDKASVPFWGFLGILVSLDLFHTNRIAKRNNK